MAGNKHDNGVHEIGTPETLKAYQEDTPGQEVEKYLAGIQEVIQEKKEKQKKTFMQVFQNPLKGFPYNEETDSPEEDTLEEGMKMKDIMRKHGRELKKAARTGNLELSDKAETDLQNWVFDNEPYVGDDPDDFDQWLDDNIEDIVKGRIK